MKPGTTGTTGTTDVDPTTVPARLSVRTRLTSAVALLTGAGFCAAGVLVYALESAAIEQSTTRQIEQEVAEFSQLEGGIDPDTGREFDSIEALIRLYLQRNVPDDDELLVGYWDDRVRLVSDSRYPQLQDDPGFLDVIQRRLTTGGTEILERDYSEVWVTVTPVRSSQDGAFVIASFLDDERGRLIHVMRNYAIVALLLLALITGAAAWQAGRLLSPLRRLHEAAQDVSGSDLSRRIPETGNDDITALTRTFNEMLARLENAFVGQRRFLDDAGHELKTPLTVVRGHMELLDPGDPGDVEATRQLLIDEVDRMSRLVNDLILLAKTDRPDFLRSDQVDLTPFLRTVLEKCRALAPRQWTLDESADQVVELDEQRITQALLQLSQNAVRHTAESDTVALGSRVSPQHGLELWVRDTGTGVGDDEKARIFERFSRGRRVADEEGFGLGLSIVSAIAHSHQGTVGVSDAPGGGAVFTLTLPLTRKEP